MNVSRGIILLVALVMLAIPACGPALGDRGGIPIDPKVEFDENAQNAIAAWNGTDEVLILSTDLRSTAPGRLLEVLPLPSSPYDVKEGNLSSFRRMIGLFNQKAERLRASSGESVAKAGALSMNDEGGYAGISISFSASIGAHDITVIHVESRTHFAEWVRDFAAGMGVANLTTTYALNDSIGDHLRRGISYFVFDVVELGGDLRTLNPMVYKFRTDFLYYPLNITAATLPNSAMTDHRIKVFLVMNGVMRDPYSDALGHLSHGAGFSEFIQFSHGELGQVSKDVSALFPTDAFVCHAYNSEYGLHEQDLSDITIRSGDIRRPTADELSRQEFKIAIRPLSPSLAYYLLESTVEESSGPVGTLLGAILVGLFLAPLVLGYIFKSVMEDRHLGKVGWVAWLAVYLVGSMALLGIAFLMASIGSENLVPLLAMALVILAPLGIAILLGDLILRKRLPYRKNRIMLIASGMGTAQVLALLFIPNAIVAGLAGIFCLPSMMVLGFAVLLVMLIKRLDRSGRDRFNEISPPLK